jgi:hypothetical protein
MNRSEGISTPTFLVWILLIIGCSILAVGILFYQHQQTKKVLAKEIELNEGLRNQINEIQGKFEELTRQEVQVVEQNRNLTEQVANLQEELEEARKSQREEVPKQTPAATDLQKQTEQAEKNIERTSNGEEVVPEITITIDKTEYKKGEVVQVVVKNDSNKTVWYNARTCPPFCYALQKLENGEWLNVSIAINVNFDLPVSPSELEPGRELSREWDMSIIKNGTRHIAETGNYRLCFYFGLNKDSYTKEIAYSKEFVVR